LGREAEPSDANVRRWLLCGTRPDSFVRYPSASDGDTYTRSAFYVLMGLRTSYCTKARKPAARESKLART
jgi:hypothetical protein